MKDTMRGSSTVITIGIDLRLTSQTSLRSTMEIVLSMQSATGLTPVQDLVVLVVAVMNHKFVKMKGIKDV